MSSTGSRVPYCCILELARLDRLALQAYFLEHVLEGHELHDNTDASRDGRRIRVQTVRGGGNIEAAQGAAYPMET